MKNIAKTIIAIAVIFTVFGTVGHIESHYMQTGTITATDSNTEEVTVVDETGNEWTFYGTGYTENDKVRIKFYTNHTDSNRKDDTIKNVKVLQKRP